MRRDINISLFIALFFIAIFLNRCGNSSPDEAAIKNHNGVREIAVTVQELQLCPFSETLQLSGTIKAYDDIMLSPEEGGVVKEWKYEKGQFVPRGATIVQLNDDVIKPGYDAAFVQYKSSELTYQKQQQVYSEQAVSEWQLKTTEYARDAARAQSDLMHARWQRTRISSPVSGILDERYADNGEMAPPGVPIARIVNLRSVKVSVNVPERYAGNIRLGSTISLTVLAFPGTVFSGKVSYVGAAINADNRTFPIESIISNPGMKLKPEMIAKAKISLSSLRNALLIEEEIIQQIDRNKLVVYVENGGKAQERIVQLGGRQDNLVEIISGVKAGEKIITSKFEEIIDGQPVVVSK